MVSLEPKVVRLSLALLEIRFMSVIPKRFKFVYLVISVPVALGAIQLFWTAYTTSSARPALIGCGAMFVVYLMLNEWRSNS